jgi:Fe-S protein assembly co-chaperone HscB
MVDYFAMFGLERRLGLDLEDLGRRFRAQSFVVHPDFHARGTQAERSNAQDRSAELNAAYRTLKDRTRYLLELEGRDPESKPSQALLFEVFEVQELLEEENSDPHELQHAQQEWQQRWASLVDDLEQAFDRWDRGDFSALDTFVEILTRRRYYENLLSTLSERLKA